MGKKGKVGKQRKDKFYNLAKETGFRSRASFKLLQLNRKFNFLQNSRICIDLCAAPGGWLQVAQQNMPQSSVIIGVDLVPIKAIPNVITFASDITTEDCRQRLKKELQDWKADCVLHDGAPNVGKNWLHDAYGQVTLTLQAFKLACEMLKKGGWFVTKVFRSSDYNALMWIFQQLFEKVHGTKPAASRNESAEIFVVCQGFKSPDKIDKRFFDVKTVFESVESQNQTSVTSKDFSKTKKRKAIGYDENNLSMHTKKTVTEFLASSNPFKFISEINELIFDQEFYKEHPLTTQDILESCKDIKLIGAKEAKDLKKWHKKLTTELAAEAEKLAKMEEEERAKMEMEDEEDSDGEDQELKDIDKKLVDLKKQEISELKRKKKLKMRALKKLRIAIAESAPSTSLGIATGADDDLFSLKKVKTQSTKAESFFEDNDEPLEFSDEEGEVELASGDEDEEDRKKSIIVDFEEKKDKQNAQMNMWFTKPIFKDMDDDITETELSLAANKYDLEKKIEEKTTEPEVPVETEKDQMEEEVSAEVEEEPEEEPVRKERRVHFYGDDEDSSDDGGFDDRGPGWEFIDSKNTRPLLPTKENGGLTPEELAVATEIAMSKKKRREHIESSFNRYQFDDDAGAVPEWFLEDEKIHQRPDSGPSVQGSKNKELVEFYKDQQKHANVRSIKKVAEAKARKKKKMVARRERARKSADGILAQEGMDEREKSAHVKNIYKKAGLSMAGGLKEKREKPTVVIGKKGIGRRVSRPEGVKGKFLVVDKRMKNDLRHKKGRENREKGKKGKTSKGGRTNGNRAKSGRPSAKGTKAGKPTSKGARSKKGR